MYTGRLMGRPLVKWEPGVKDFFFLCVASPIWQAWSFPFCFSLFGDVGWIAGAREMFGRISGRLSGEHDAASRPAAKRKSIVNGNGHLTHVCPNFSDVVI